MDFASLFSRLNLASNDMPKEIKQMKKKFKMSLGPVEYVRLRNRLYLLESFEEMFSLLWKCPAAHQFLLCPEDIYQRKMKDLSENCRTTGNDLYRRRELEDALKFYNLSIVFAPHPKLQLSNTGQGNSDTNHGNSAAKQENGKVPKDKYKALSCGYANRSAVFLSMGEYKKCLLDIDLAIEYGYPRELRGKLLERKERCLKAQRQSALREDGSVKIVSLSKIAPPVLSSYNPSIPAFSSSLEVTNSNSRGRHIVVTRDIPPGELLAVEESYCSFVRYNETILQACAACFIRCDQFVPCPGCIAVFCSKECRTKGVLGAHGKECKILPYVALLGLGADDLLMALRMVVQTTFPELKERLPLLRREAEELPPEKLGFDQAGNYRSSDYRAVYHITAYNSKKNHKRLFDLCIVAFLLTKLLHVSGEFFIDRLGNKIHPSAEDFITTGAALLYHMGHDSKFFEVSDLKLISPGGVMDNKGVGYAMFPSVWLIRHSCNPNAAHYNMGGVRVVRSVLSIPAGSEVTLMFSEGFFLVPMPVRKFMLASRGIDCSCVACINNWPTGEELPEDIVFKCLKCSKPVTEKNFIPVCESCSIIYTRNNSKNLLVQEFWSIVDEVCETEYKYESSVSKMDKGMPLARDDFDNISNYITVLEKHASLPCRALCETRKAMLKLFMLENQA